MKIHFHIFIVGLLLTSCTCKNEAFEDKKLFADYVAKLSLTSLSIQEAGSRLNAENFKCENVSNNQIICTRGVPAGGCVCGENQNIYLSTKQDSSLKIETYLQLACL
jgi:hypothetical protein